MRTLRDGDFLVEEHEEGEKDLGCADTTIAIVQKPDFGQIKTFFNDVQSPSAGCYSNIKEYTGISLV